MSQPSDDPAVPAAVSELSTQLAAGDYELVPLHGDASSRRYFRLKSKSESFILVNDAEAGPYLKDLTGTKLAGLQKLPAVALNKSQTLRFLFWTVFLHENGIAVPEILGVHKSALAISDLSDVNLTALNDIEHDKAALQSIAALHSLDYESTRLDWSPLVFIEDKLRPEIQFLLDRLAEVPGHLSPAEKKLSKLAAELTDETNLWYGRIRGGEKATCLNHRDFHGRNVHWFKDRPYLIDYQDIFSAHPEYDLVSFVFDPYRSQSGDWSDDDRNTLLEAYRGRAPVDGDLLWYYGLQRLTKCIGSYVWLGINQGRPEFVPSLTGAVLSLHSLGNTTGNPLPAAVQELIFIIEEITNKLDKR